MEAPAPESKSSFEAPSHQPSLRKNRSSSMPPPPMCRRFSCRLRRPNTTPDLAATRRWCSPKNRQPEPEPTPDDGVRARIRRPVAHRHHCRRTTGHCSMTMNRRRTPNPSSRSHRWRRKPEPEAETMADPKPRQIRLSRGNQRRRSGLGAGNVRRGGSRRDPRAHRRASGAESIEIGGDDDGEEPAVVQAARDVKGVSATSGDTVLEPLLKRRPRQRGPRGNTPAASVCWRSC